MNWSRRSRLCACAAAVVVLCAAVAFGARPAPEPDVRTESVTSLSAPATRTPEAPLAGRSQLSTTIATSVRPMKERRALPDALLLGALLLGALSFFRRRVDVRRRDHIAISAFFAPRRGPPSLRLAR